MHKVVILACCALSISFATSIRNHTNTFQKLETSSGKDETVLKYVKKIVSKNLNQLVSSQQSNTGVNLHLKSETNEKNVRNVSKTEHYTKEVQKSFSMLHKFHARITRSKNAVWATITLTFMCVLLVLAVAQSRMWKDHYYTEAQGIPLPNFNERVLFKDVMERKMKSMKQFFKKRSKDQNTTELESLLPPSEWDT